MPETVSQVQITQLVKSFEEFQKRDEDWKRRHDDKDDRRFGAVDAAVASVKAVQDSQSGGIGMAKWMIGLGIPAIIAMLGLLLARHP